MIFLIIVLILAVSFIIYSFCHDKLMIINIKLTNIEEKIDSILIERHEILKDSEVLIKDVLNTKKEIFTGLSGLNYNRLTRFEFDRKLLTYANEFYLVKDKYKELNENDSFQKLSFSLAETEDLLCAYKDFYNDSTENYNTTLKKFPIVIYSILSRKKEKSFFDKK
ncbi:MAG: LemA family protein [Bacilli bacterium]